MPSGEVLFVHKMCNTDYRVYKLSYALRKSVICAIQSLQSYSCCNEKNASALFNVKNIKMFQFKDMCLLCGPEFPQKVFVVIFVKYTE